MNHNPRAGFTLIETIIYLAIFSFISAVIIPSFVLIESRAAQLSRAQALIVEQDFAGWYVRSMIEHGAEVMIPSRGMCAREIGARVAGGGVMSITTNASSTLVMRGGWGHDTPLHDGVWRVDYLTVCRREEPFGESIEYSFDGTASSTVFVFKKS